MFINLWRIIKYGFQSFLRNRWLSISTISIMILTLIVFQGLILFNVFSSNATEAVKDKVDITVYFKSNVAEDNILNIQQVLENFDEVEDVTYTSRDEALEEFRATHEDDETITQTLDEVDDNPLLASLSIKAGELDQYDTIASYLNSESLEDVVESVTYAENRLVINRLQNLITGMNAGVLSLTLFLAFLAVVVTLNTISLAIFSNKEQINIMRMVGASNKFIRGPYIVEGIMYGIIAAGISFIIFMPIVDFVSPYLGSFVPGFNLAEYFYGNTFTLVLYQVILGVGLGVISSTIAVRRYLKA